MSQRFTTCRQRARRSSQGGFTLLEVLITASVLLVGLLAMTSTSVVVNSLRRNASDQQRAQAAMQAIVEDLHATARQADDDPALWAGDVLAVYGVGGAPGALLPVAGLDAWPGAPSVATVTIVTDETLTDAALGVALGMPRDLDGDGAANSPDVSGSASLLPAIVQLRWTGSTGQHQLSQVVYLLRY